MAIEGEGHIVKHRPIPQQIGERTVPNPSGRVEMVGDVLVWLSGETCSCGWSQASPGVGYRDEIRQAWVCKKCDEAHTVFTTEEEYFVEQRKRIRFYMP